MDPDPLQQMALVLEMPGLEPRPATPLHALHSNDASELGSLAEPAISQQNGFTGLSRRVQPQRARKAGFGSAEVDNLIIEAIERDDKLKSLIPPDTVIHCTTDSSKLPNAHEIVDRITFETQQEGQSSRTLSLHSYFRNTEVMESLRNQQRIETAEFSLITEDDIKQALASIPEEFLYKNVDLSDETFRRRHARVQKVETRTRNREKERLLYDVSRLSDRLSQLEAMDASNFRGDTFEEQEKDKQKILTFTRQMVNRKVDKVGTDSEDEQPSGTASARPVAREKKPRPPKKPRTSLQDVEPLANTIPKPPRVPKKKEPKYIYQPDELVFEDQYYPERPDLDEEYFEGPTSSKRSKKSTKRKRVVEPELDPALYEFVVTTAPPVPKKPKKSSSSKKKSAFHRPVASITGEATVSKLLEQASRYNPNRQPRDIYPFGAPIPHALSNFVDFELPEWIEQDSRPQSMHPSEDDIAQSELVGEGEDEDAPYDEIEEMAHESSGVFVEEEGSDMAEDGVERVFLPRREDLDAETSGLSSLESDEGGPEDEASPRRRRGGVRY